MDVYYQSGHGRAHPVFHDPKGNRRWRLAALLLLAATAVAAVLQTAIPQANLPLLAAASDGNQSPDYPRKLAASIHGQLPVLAADNVPDTEQEPLTRIAAVKRSADPNQLPALVDPFDGHFIRWLRDNELEAVGNSSLVMDRFGLVPDGTLMLTFDDGPDSLFTPQILDVLARNHVPATFFTIGANIAGDPGVFQRLIKEGHMAGSHTYTHLGDFVDNSDAANRGELTLTDHMMRATAGYAAPIWRLPEGNPEQNPLAILTAQQLGYLQVDFDLDTNDWRFQPGQPVPVPPLDGHGHVVLMHDGGGDRSDTVRLLQQLITEAKAQGYRFTTLAPIIPASYQPHIIQPTWLDRIVQGYAFATQSLPALLLRWLFIFGVGSVVVMTICIEWPLVLWHRLRRRSGQAANPPLADQRFSVSVVIPVFNEEACINRTLSALRDSSYPLLEVIAVNDGSTDGTLAMLNAYAKQWPALRVINQPNSGKPAALNNGVRQANGTVIVALDGDTMFEPGTIGALVQPFTDPYVGAVAGQVKVDYSRKRNLLTMWQSLEYITGIGVSRNAQHYLNAIMVVPGACGAWRKDALAFAGGFTDHTLAEDADMALTLRREGWHIVQAADAVAWTEAPWTLSSFARQRLRWSYGQLQALYKHRRMLFNVHYGWLGFVAMPYAALSVIIPWLFMIPAYISAVALLASGAWQPVALFGGFMYGVQLVTSGLALWSLDERRWLQHLLLVPAYRPLYELLRVFVLYGSTFQIAMGGMRKFYRPQRLAGDDMLTLDDLAPVTPSARLTQTP